MTRKERFMVSRYRYQLSIWVKHRCQLDFMGKQLGGIPSEIRQRERDGKYALYRPKVVTPDGDIPTRPEWLKHTTFFKG